MKDKQRTLNSTHAACYLNEKLSAKWAFCIDMNDQRKRNHIRLTIVRLRLPIMLSVSEREGGVGAAREARALLRLQAAHPHVLEAVIRRGVHLGLRVHV